MKSVKQQVTSGRKQVMYAGLLTCLLLLAPLENLINIVRKNAFIFIISLTVFLTGLVTCHFVQADVITLKNGSTIEGKVVEDDGQTVTIKVDYGELSVDRGDIESIVKSKYEPEVLPPEEELLAEPPEEPTEIKPTEPVSPTQSAKPVEKISFEISDEDKTEQQKKINAHLRELANNTKEPWQAVILLGKEVKNDVPYVIGLLKEIEEPALRHWLVYVLGRTEDERILEPLRPELKHPDERVRATAVEALQSFKGDALQGEFEELLKTETAPKVSCALIRVLASWQDYSIISDLINLLGNKDKTLQRSASQALVKFYQSTKGQETSEPDVLTLLLEKLSFAEAALKKTIMTVLGQIKDKRSLEVLIELLTDEEAEIRALAAMGLAEIADKETIRILMECLQEETDVWTRIQIMQVFQKKKDYDTIPVLIETLNDEDENIKLAAARSLRTITKRPFGADYDRWKEWWDTLQGKK